jgi:hypothetical protein
MDLDEILDAALVVAAAGIAVSSDGATRLVAIAAAVVAATAGILHRGRRRTT